MSAALPISLGRCLHEIDQPTVCCLGRDGIPGDEHEVKQQNTSIL